MRLSLPRVAWAILLLQILTSSLGFAEIQFSKKHVYMLQPGVDEVWGSYLFFVQNSGEPAAGQMVLPLPREQVDFGPQEGLIPKDLQLDPDRGVIVDKEFPEGSNLFSVGFKVPANGGIAKLTIAFNQIGGEKISFLTPKGSLTMTGEGLAKGDEVRFGASIFDSWEMDTAGDQIRVDVKGVVGGRRPFWILGWIFCALLFLGGAALTFTVDFMGESRGRSYD